jgi:hypothetical protein
MQVKAELQKKEADYKELQAAFIASFNENRALQHELALWRSGQIAGQPHLATPLATGATPALHGAPLEVPTLVRTPVSLFTPCSGGAAPGTAANVDDRTTKMLGLKPSVRSAGGPQPTPDPMPLALAQDGGKADCGVYYLHIMEHGGEVPSTETVDKANG